MIHQTEGDTFGQNVAKRGDGILGIFELLSQGNKLGGVGFGRKGYRDRLIAALNKAFGNSLAGCCKGDGYPTVALGRGGLGQSQNISFPHPSVLSGSGNRSPVKGELFAQFACPWCGLGGFWKSVLAFVGCHGQVTCHKTTAWL